ncbi:hypothetical protein ACFOY4_09770 [Actinomadura syzygii]|uniref:Uncharacterized protein n=1 Tax=Actinomadura syzygii TaxID=1427538 RepID=A0A5D0UCX3_9ACTN|nr:hypothetical protein [Actinomadura syzygii]TYC15894.1 hypothetical protein FXF65_11170 [Actinomadura syzygii]
MSDPGGGARHEFASRFSELLVSCDLTYDRISARVSGRRPEDMRWSVNAKSISDWKQGHNLPRSWEPFRWVLRILVEDIRVRIPAARQDGLLLDESRWRLLWERARSERGSAKGIPAAASEGGEGGRPGPLTLGVRQSLQPDLSAEQNSLTAYLHRPHDRILWESISLVRDGGKSVFCLLYGDSATGKSRALYEALQGVVPDWPVHFPIDTGDLLRLVDEGRITEGCVLWLDETQKYLQNESDPRASAELIRLLQSVRGFVVLGTIWQHPYLADLTARGRSPDVNAVARDLLGDAYTVRIHVPDSLSGAQQEELAALAAVHEGDPRLTAALAGGADHGDVIQHLTGGPELVRRFSEGGFFRPVELALLTAALDAKRLGHFQPLSEGLLREAADGYLEPRHRSGEHGWATGPLRALTTGERSDGSRTDVHGAVPALVAVRERSGQVTPRYQPDDYLDQQIRRARRRLGAPARMWNALLNHAHDPDDLERAATAAHEQGLHRISVLLRRKAVGAGSGVSAIRLMQAFGEYEASGRADCAVWLADRVALTNLHLLVQLGEQFSEAGARGALNTLHRRLADVLPVDPLASVLQWIDAMGRAGSDEGMETLLNRAVDEHAIDEPSALARLLRALRRAGAPAHIDALMGRNLVENIDIRDAAGVDSLLEELAHRPETGQLDKLLSRRPETVVRIDELGAVQRLVTRLQGLQAGHAATALIQRTLRDGPWADPEPVGALLSRLPDAARHEAAVELAHRTDDQRVRLMLLRMAMSDAPTGTSFVVRHTAAGYGLLDAAGWIGGEPPPPAPRTHGSESRRDLQAPDAFSREKTAGPRRPDREHDLAAERAARTVRALVLTDPAVVARTLDALRDAGLHDQMVLLLARDPARHARLKEPDRVAALLSALSATGDEAQTRELAKRITMGLPVDRPRLTRRFITQIRQAGFQELATLLGQRAAATVDLAVPGVVAATLEALRAAGLDDQMAFLLDRDPARHTDLHDSKGISALAMALESSPGQLDLLCGRAAGAAPTDDAEPVSRMLGLFLDLEDRTALLRFLSRVQPARIRLGNPYTLGRLLDALLRADASAAFETVRDRLLADPPLDNVHALRHLLDVLHRADSDSAVRELGARAARRVRVQDVGAVDLLLEALCRVEAEEGVSLLANRLVEWARLAETTERARVLAMLRRASLHEAVDAVVDHSISAGEFQMALAFANAEFRARYKFGREPDGSPSAPWGWDSPDAPE